LGLPLFLFQWGKDRWAPLTGTEPSKNFDPAAPANMSPAFDIDFVGAFLLVLVLTSLPLFQRQLIASFPSPQMKWLKQNRNGSYECIFGR
jgi:hypothetical protein